MFFEQKLEDAVSPVVGVILMVAVTVILAAVIGAFVLDLGNNVQANPQAGVTFDQSPNATSGTDVAVQVVSMENADFVMVNAESGFIAGGEEHYDGNAGAYELDGVGDSLTVEGVTTDGHKITVVGVLSGKQAVIQTYSVSV